MSIPKRKPKGGNFVEKPYGFEVRDSRYFVHPLQKYLHRMKQESRSWNNKYVEEITTVIGIFKYTHRKLSLLYFEGKQNILLVVYVDDISHSVYD